MAGIYLFTLFITLLNDFDAEFGAAAHTIAAQDAAALIHSGLAAGDFQGFLAADEHAVAAADTFVTDVQVTPAGHGSFPGFSR
jgi:hypothetical protein